MNALEVAYQDAMRALHDPPEREPEFCDQCASREASIEEWGDDDVPMSRRVYCEPCYRLEFVRGKWGEEIHVDGEYAATLSEGTDGRWSIGVSVREPFSSLIGNGSWETLENARTALIDTWAGYDDQEAA